MDDFTSTSNKNGSSDEWESLDDFEIPKKKSTKSKGKLDMLQKSIELLVNLFTDLLTNYHVHFHLKDYKYYP